MKNFRVLMIVMIFLGTMVYANAQKKVAKVYPKHGVMVTKIYKPKVIVHRGVTFHFSDGVWYRPQGKKYVVCAIPVGITVKRLPRGHKVVRVNGRKLYKYRGVWYKKSGRGYIIVNV